MDAKLSSLDKRILDELKNNGSMKARQLSKVLGVEKNIINAELYGPLKDYCVHDDNFMWSLKQNIDYYTSNKFDEHTYFCLLNEDDKKLNNYLFKTQDDLLNSPQLLFVKPFIKGHIFSHQQITLLLDFITSHNIDLNSTDFYLNRNDNLKGIDLAGGCLCFPIFYLVQGKKKTLNEEEVEMYSRFVLEARKRGWLIGNFLSNKKKVQNLLRLLISKNHKELQPIYDALFLELTPNLVETQDFGLPNKETSVKDECLESRCETKSDDYTLCIPNTTKNVQMDTANEINNSSFEDTDLSKKNIKTILKEDSFLNSRISGFSNRTSNRLFMYGIVTYRDLLKLDLHDFSTKRGIEETVIKEISERIQQIKASNNFAETSLSDSADSLEDEHKVYSDTLETDVASSSIGKPAIDEAILNEKISGFSNLAYNKLMIYGIRTNKDLIDLDLDMFINKRGVTHAIIDEIKARVQQLKGNQDIENSSFSNNLEENVDEFCELTRIVNSLSQIYQTRAKETSVGRVFLNNPSLKKYHSPLLDNANQLFGCSLDDYFKKIGIVVDSNEEEYNENNIMIAKVNHLKSIYSNKKPENSMYEVFEKNPNLKKDYVYLTLNAPKLFGMGLEDYLKTIGIVKNQVNEINKEVFAETSDDSIEDSSVFDNNKTEYLKDSDNTQSSIKIQNFHIEETRMLQLLDSLFKEKKVNLKIIEGTSLYRKLQNYAQIRNVSVNMYLNIIGYTLDDSVSEKYRLNFFRRYD